MVASLYPDPLGVDEVIALTRIGDLANRKTTKLSGGQTQRLRFAVGLVSNPELLVLDEPTVAMDVEARRQFWATMREFASRGKTVVFATHYLEEADAYADRIILMAHGQVVADGPATEIKATVGLRTIRATLPGADVAALARAARRDERRDPRRRHHPQLRELRRRRCAPSCRPIPPHATSRSPAPGWKRRSCN